jgi:HD-like signal output (HDOD) protein
MAVLDLYQAETFLDSLPDLPSLSKAAQEVVRSIAGGKDNFTAIARVVDSDPVLAAGVLKVANSAYYARSTPVGSISTAIARLGMDEVRALVCTAALLREFQGAGKSIDLDDFWRHSLSTAVACHVIVHPGLPASGSLLGDNPFYLCGLMHHLGILLEAIHRPVEFAQARLLAHERGCGMEQAEREIFGFGHSESGAALLRRWKSPGMVVDAALYHLAPESCPGDRRPAQVVHLAGMLCHELGANSYEGVAPWVSEESFLKLGWDIDKLPALQERVRLAIENAQQLLGALTAA